MQKTVGLISARALVNALTESSQTKNKSGIPKIVHHMHQSREALNELQARLVDGCRLLNPGWTFLFWDDAKIEAMVRADFPGYYDSWSSMHPPIKKIDSSRYMLLHRYGGIYIDVDVECVSPLDSLVRPLPAAAWVGDFPEPMFAISAPGNRFWLYMLDRVRRTWNAADAWHSTGPAGLNAALVEWVNLHGVGVLAPFITQRPEAAFHAFIKNKNGTLPWFELANGNWKLPRPTLDIWHAPAARRSASNTFPASDAPILEDMRIGFLANELLDPASCSAATLRHCVNGLCKSTWPLSYLVHHCTNTWRGRIGN